MKILTTKNRPPHELLTIQELAVYLRVTVRTLRSWVAEQKIPHRRVGCHLRFSRAEVDEWSRDHEHQPK